MGVRIREATLEDAGEVASILREAADWLRERGIPLWLEPELREADVRTHVEAGHFHLAERDGEPAGTFRFELSDPEFWPDVPPGESAFVHRLAVRRRFAGCGVSEAMLTWAAERARGLGLAYLRLDCDAARPRLRAVYERFGFRYHSDRHLERIHVARYELALE